MEKEYKLDWSDVLRETGLLKHLTMKRMERKGSNFKKSLYVT